MCLHDTVYNWNVGSRDFVHGNVSCVIPFMRRVCQEEQVASVKRRLHRSTEITFSRKVIVILLEIRTSIQRQWVTLC